jgi:hypothetical protein
MDTKLMLEIVERKRKFAREELDKFAANMAKNPAYALEWSGGAFTAAGDYEVCSWILAAVDENAGVGLEKIIKQLERDVLRAARYPSRSTSPTSNLMEQEIARAKAELLETLDREVR